MNKRKMAIVESDGVYLGDIDSSDAAQLHLAKTIINGVHESKLMGASTARKKGDEIYAQYKDSALSVRERRRLAPMAASAIKIIQRDVGSVSDDAGMFAQTNGLSIGSARTGKKSGIYSLQTLEAVFELNSSESRGGAQ